MIDLTNQRFERLIVVKETVRNKFNQRQWICQCDCGYIKTITQNNLRQNKAKSCGCLQKEIISKITASHGLCDTPEYNSWSGMKSRCNNPKEPAYKNYGARGIKVCERWNIFENFINDMGSKPSPEHTLERINNNDDYYPKNCKWATKLEQVYNRRNTRRVKYQNRTITLKQLAKELHMDYSNLASSIKIIEKLANANVEFLFENKSLRFVLLPDRT